MTTTDNTVGDLNHLNTQATTTTTKQPTNCATYILKKIQDDRTSATSVGFLSNWVREWYLNHPNELVNELKKNNWDITSAGGQIASNLNNNVLSCIPNKTTEDGDKKSSPLDNENNNWKSMIREFETKKNELEKELKSLKSRKGFLYQLSSDEITDDTYKLRNEVESKIFEKEIEVKILKDDFKGLKKSHEDNLKKLIKNKPSAYDDISLTGKDLDNFLKGIINGISSLDNYKAEPTDLEARMKFNPRKLMTLQEALFTILWNTRPQTISSSIINLKAWCAAFMRFVKYGTRDSNTPGMLTFISRKDNGDVKGSCGKTTIFKSLLQLLEENGISVTPYVDPVAFPTRKVIDKKMSGRTLVFFDDVGQDSVVGNDYETMNQFLDGRNLRTKMKYEKEVPIFSLGYAIATTNHDTTYPNLKRYPRVEFTPNDSRAFYTHPLVQEHAKFTVDVEKGIYDYRDAWETLLSYASENIMKWLDEYSNSSKVRVTQFNRKHKVVLATIRAISKNTFTAKYLIDKLEQTYKNELSYKLSISQAASILEELGIHPINKEANDEFQYEYSKPEQEIRIDSDYSRAIEEVWAYIEKEVK